MAETQTLAKPRALPHACTRAVRSPPSVRRYSRSYCRPLEWLGVDGDLPYLGYRGIFAGSATSAATRRRWWAEPGDHRALALAIDLRTRRPTHPPRPGLCKGLAAHGHSDLEGQESNGGPTHASASSRYPSTSRQAGSPRGGVSEGRIHPEVGPKSSVGPFSTRGPIIRSHQKWDGRDTRRPEETRYRSRRVSASRLFRA